MVLQQQPFSPSTPLFSITQHPQLSGISRVPTLAFSTDGKLVASASDFTTIKVWDNETGREVLSLQHTKPVTDETIIGIGPPLVTGLSFSPGGKRLVTISREAMKLWNVQTGEGVSTMQDMGTAMASGVAFSPDGSRIANSKTSAQVESVKSSFATPSPARNC
jgi:WD40 repeat protein